MGTTKLLEHNGEQSHAEIFIKFYQNSTENHLIKDQNLKCEGPVGFFILVHTFYSNQRISVLCNL